MKWIQLLVELAGPIISTIRSIAGEKWDPDKAEAVLKGLVRNPPRQAVSDEKRAQLERIARGTTGSD